MNNQIICKREPDNVCYVMFLKREYGNNCVYIFPNNTSIVMCRLEEDVFKECTVEITQEEFNAALDKTFASIKTIAQTNC